MVAVPAQDRLLGTKIGSYLVKQKLGEGGMGTVYELVHPAIGKRMALKVLHPEYAGFEEIVQRFYDEARAANLIDHPAVVEVYDFAQLADGTYYVLMEYLDGQSVAELLEERGPLDAQTIQRIMLPVCSALQAFHGAGLVHRDIKPDNLFVCDNGPIKVLDLGIVKLSHRDGGFRTRTGDLIGTPSYMPPEQARGDVHNITGSTDTYALGAVLFHMLTGCRPYEGLSTAEIIEAVVAGRSEAIEISLQGVPAPWAAIVHRSMAHSPTARYNNMDEFAADIARTHTPTLAVQSPQTSVPTRLDPDQPTVVAGPRGRREVRAVHVTKVLESGTFILSDGSRAIPDSQIRAHHTRTTLALSLALVTAVAAVSSLAWVILH